MEECAVASSAPTRGHYCNRRERMQAFSAAMQYIVDSPRITSIKSINYTQIRGGTIHLTNDQYRDLAVREDLARFAAQQDRGEALAAV